MEYLKNLANFASKQVSRQIAQIEFFLKECTYHACLNHHLDTFIFDGIDLRVKLK